MNKLILICLFLTACSYSTYYVPTSQNVYPPTEAHTIPVSALKTMRYSHKVIGRVATIVWGGGESAREELQAQAARLGANAIIDLRIEKSWARTSASGLAIFVTEPK